MLENAEIERKTLRCEFRSLCRSRCGEFDADGESAAFRLGERRVSPVGCEDARDDGEAEAGAFSHGQAPRREAGEVLRFVEEYFPGTQPGEFGPIAACRGDGEVLGLLKIIDNRFATVLVF